MSFIKDFYSIILIMPPTIMMLMKFAEKCPKCGGFVQTKSVRKSIGLGFVEIPVAQFCLNPVCDWYQDFAETKKPEDIKEGFQLKIPSFDRKLPAYKKPEFKIPEISKNQMIALAAIVGLIVIYTIFTYFVPVNHFDPGNDVNQKQYPGQSGLQNNNTTLSSVTPKITAIVPTTIPAIAIPPSIIEPPIKFDVGHGFYPQVITINKSDTITWNNEENQRTRIVLVSNDGLFEKQLMLYPGRYQYQFKQEGKYTFILAEYPSYKVYQNTTGTVIVR
ncbi:hypothetical protein METP3_02207 [Methanosarcinales archaeon]|nr:hypothetical protein METP3_02207 [Methanosarcinales archaeon]